MATDPNDPDARRRRLRVLEDAPRPLVTPSILDCDFARIGAELDAVADAGVRVVHLDVMDGHFVPNISYGPSVIADWRRYSDLTFDAHLMISEPGRYLDSFVAAGCDVIIFHIEVEPNPGPLLARIRAAGCRAALAINPPTPVETLAPWLDQVDAVLVMSVMPGFGGQAFQPAVLDKVRYLKRTRPALQVAIDGGIHVGTAAQAAAAGVDQFVAGSAVFKAAGHDYGAAYRAIESDAGLGAARFRAQTSGSTPPLSPGS